MGLEDLALFRAIPTATVFYPSDGVSTEKAVELAANTKVPALPALLKRLSFERRQKWRITFFEHALTEVVVVCSRVYVSFGPAGQRATSSTTAMKTSMLAKLRPVASSSTHPGQAPALQLFFHPFNIRKTSSGQETYRVPVRAPCGTP